MTKIRLHSTRIGIKMPRMRPGSRTQALLMCLLLCGIAFKSGMLFISPTRQPSNLPNMAAIDTSIFNSGECCRHARIKSLHQPRDVVCKFMRSRDNLVYMPSERPSKFGTTCLAYADDLSSQAPEFSVLVNVYNAAAKIRVVLTQLLKMTRSPWELVIHFDGCQDDSYEVVVDVLKRSKLWPVCPYSEKDIDHARVWQSGQNLTGSQGDIGNECWLGNDSNSSTLVSVRLIKTTGLGLLETASDNIKMLASRAPYLILVHDDQIMTVPGWNEKLVMPLQKWPHVFSVSMRCGHGYPTHGDYVGPKCRNSMNVQSTDPTDRCAFHETDTGNRGPLAIRAAYLHKLGYLNEVQFLGGLTTDDDHDLNWRAYRQRGWISGHLPVDYTEERCCRGASSENPLLRKEYIEWLQARKRNHTLYVPVSESASPSNTHRQRHAIKDPNLHAMCS